MRWDVFCRVIDNYGDAGVCWRLARQLAHEHHLDVTLWIDRQATLARIEPGIDPAAVVQRHIGVTLRALGADDAGSSGGVDPAPVVIEGFGCGLPARYLDAMEARDPAPLWVNLEYLSAEPWVDGVHGLASVHPQRRLTRYFWFPGFTATSGGLLREAGLFDARDAAQREQNAVRAVADEAPPAVGSCGAAAAATTGLELVLFCYENRALPALFELWSCGASPVRCIVPEGVAPRTLAGWLGGAVPPPPCTLTRGNLVLDLRSFASRDDFDRLLCTAAVNFVRGEDSFVRAQWAARPFVWQPYPQEGGAQRAKLDAFLARYVPDTADPVQDAQRRMMRAFDAEEAADAVSAWTGFRALLPASSLHARRWASTLATMPDLASSLVAFVRTRL